MDTNKLKELAERATPGRNFDRLPSAGGGLKYTCTGDDGSLVLRVDHKNDLFGFIGPKGEEDEAFFLACTPQAILGLIAEVERLRKDAERYRWLRDLPRGTSHGDLTIMLAKNRPAPNQWCTDTIRGESLDAAIDAALEGGGR